MDQSTRRILISLFVILVVICLCLSVLGAGWAAVIIWGRSTQNSSSSETEVPVIELTQDEIERQMDEIQAQVIALRGLQPTSIVTRSLLTNDELRQHILEDFNQDYSPAEASDDVLALAAFGLLEPDFDLYNFSLELYSEQIAGFYDHETKEMYVVKGKGFEGPERMTYAHEYVHALQDQNYDIQNGLEYTDESCEENSERCAAIQSLLEGDASILELTWFSLNATSQDQQDIQEFYNSFESPVYDSAPDFMKADFLFPYESGRAFVQTLYDAGGWAAVDAAYQNLPVSTEQILHPERYPQDVPVSITLPDLSSLLGDGWRLLDEDVLGEWYTYLVLAYTLEEDARLADSIARQAAEGWGGDTYAIYYNDQLQQTVLVLKSQWDHNLDAQSFTDAFQKLSSARFGDPITSTDSLTVWQETQGFTEFHSEGDTTTWIFAPDASIAQSIWSVLSSQ